MSAFGGLILTNKGRNLQAKAQTGVQLNFTRIAVGDGDLAGTSILDLNALKNEVKSLAITKLKTMTGGKAVVGTVFSNETILVGFYWRELGVFAQDPDLGEILYCYGNAGVNAEYIPSGGGPDIIEKSIDVVSLVGNATNVTATIESSLVYVTAQDFSDHIDDLNNPHQATVAQIGAETPAGAQAKADVVQATVTTHIADAIKHMTAAERTVWNAKETTTGSQTKATAAQTAATSYTDTKLAALVDSSPATLDTLKELADALGDDPNYAATISALIGTKETPAGAQAKADVVQTNLTEHQADVVYQVAGGTATALTLTMATLVGGYTKTFIASATDASTSKTINGKPFYKPGTVLSPSLTINKAYTVWYNLAGDCFFIKASAEGTAVAADVLAGKTFSSDADTGLAGTMVDRGAVSLTPGTTSKVIAEGYHNGSGVVIGDADLISSNILSGKNIFGVAGSVINGAGLKKTASGSVSITPEGYKDFVITGVGFTPSVIIVLLNNLWSATYSSVSLRATDNGRWDSANNVNSSDVFSQYTCVKNISNGTFTVCYPTSVVTPTPTTIYWLAFE